MFTMTDYYSARPGQAREMILESNENRLSREIKEIAEGIEDLRYDLDNPYDKRCDLVEFSHPKTGVKTLGMVNNLQKRLTVLVKCRRMGFKFSDGVRYEKFYIPKRLARLVRRGSCSILRPSYAGF